VLGWVPMVYSTLQELCVAGENQASSRIVLMSELPRLEMESLLQARRKNRHGTRIVGRSGRPSDIDDLILVQAHHANSVITPPSKTSIDATTIKTVLAVAEDSRRLGSEPHMIAPIFRQSFVTVARLAALEPGVGDVDGSRRSDRERIVTCPCPDPVHPQPVGRHGAEGSDGTGRRHRRPDPARVSRRPRVLEQDLLRDAGERRGAEAVLSHRDQVRRTALRRAGAQSRTNRRSALVPDIPLIVAFGIGPIMRMFGGGNALASRPIGLGTSTHGDGATAGGGVSRQQSGKDARIPEA
jgi:hypothetical protein